MKNTISKIEAKASALLSRLNFLSLPISVENIAKCLHITISYDLGDDISGLLISKKDSTVIGVNPLESMVRQRFTIAHEIGHYILHRDKADLFVDKDYIVLKRSGEKSNLELEANAFAASLLMPFELVEKEIEKLTGTGSTDEKIKTLARIFEVSTIAMTYRLSNLNLI